MIYKTKIFVVFCTTLFFVSTYSQELVKNINLEIDNKTTYFHTIDDQNNQLSFFLINKTDVESILFDENIEIKTKLKTAIPDKKYKSIIGNGFEDGNGVIYWLNSKDKEVFTANLVEIDLREEALLRDLK